MPIQNTGFARENYRRHTWAQDVVKGWKQDVAYAMKQDRAFFDRMLPTLTPWPEYGQNCPACVGRLSTMGETGLYEWSIENPDRLVCKYCRTEYPNADYPETGHLTAPRMGQTFSYYLNDEERAHPDEKTGVYAFRWITEPAHTSWSGILRSQQGRWCFEQVLPLAWLYVLTDDISCAERVIWILDIAAQRYPNWLFHAYDGTYADCPPAEAAAELGRHPRGGRFPAETIITAFEGRHREGDHAALFRGFWGAGRFGCSGGDAGILLKMTLAYDLVRDAKKSDGSTLLHPEADERIRRDLLLAGCEDMEHWNEINNKCGPARALSAIIGRLFNRPDGVRRAIEGFEALIEKGFHADGFCTESPSYSDMFLNLMRQIPDLLAGYTDPPDYIPEQGDRLENFDPYTYFGHYRLALESMIRMLDPNMLYPVIGDTHAGNGLKSIHAEVLTAHYGRQYAGLLERTLGAPLAEAGDEYALRHRDPDLAVDAPTELPLRTEWWPDWQVGVLRGGSSPDHTAFYFNGYAQGGHRHYDTLGISYIAHRTELAADRGYIWDDPRGVWTKSTFSHNIVTVDGENQNHPDRRSTLELFGKGPGVEVVQASAKTYTQCDRYQRTCVLVELPDGGNYAVDFFSVEGGRSHHYGFHCNGTLTDVKGATFTTVNTSDASLEQWLKWVKQPQAAQTDRPVSATWMYDGIHMDLHLLSDIDRLLVADAPGWRNCEGSQINAPPVQQILAERTDAEKTVSRFAAVMVPYSGPDSPVIAAELSAYEPDSGAMAIEVRLADRTDYILTAPNYAERRYGKISMAGRFGFLSVDSEGQPLRAYLLDGTRLEYEGLKCRLPRGRSHISVEATEDRTFTLARPLPDQACQVTDFLLAGDTGYDIETIRDNVIRVRDYPAIPCEAVTLLHALSWSP